MYLKTHTKNTRTPTPHTHHRGLKRPGVLILVYANYFIPTSTISLLQMYFPEYLNYCCPCDHLPISNSGILLTAAVCCSFTSFVSFYCCCNCSSGRRRRNSLPPLQTIMSLSDHLPFNTWLSSWCRTTPSLTILSRHQPVCVMVEAVASTNIIVFVMSIHLLLFEMVVVYVFMKRYVGGLICYP